MSRRTKQPELDKVYAFISHSRENGNVVAVATAPGVTLQAAAKYPSTAGVDTVRRMADTDVIDAVRADRDGQPAARIGRRVEFAPLLFPSRSAYMLGGGSLPGSA